MAGCTSAAVRPSRMPFAPPVWVCWVPSVIRCVLHWSRRQAEGGGRSERVCLCACVHAWERPCVCVQACGHANVASALSGNNKSTAAIAARAARRGVGLLPAGGAATLAGAAGTTRHSRLVKWSARPGSSRSPSREAHTHQHAHSHSCCCVVTRCPTCAWGVQRPSRGHSVENSRPLVLAFPPMAVAVPTTTTRHTHPLQPPPARSAATAWRWPRPCTSWRGGPRGTGLQGWC